MKSYTDLEQSKILAEILPIESADMTLPFRHTKDNKYLPGYVITRTYTEVYNEMIVLSGMEKQELCKLINPCWSLAALLNILPNDIEFKGDKYYLKFMKDYVEYANDEISLTGRYLYTIGNNNLVDACYEMVLKLHEQKLL